MPPQGETSIERSGDPLADVVAELQAELESIKAEHTRKIAEKESALVEKDAEIQRLTNEVDAAEIRGARAILADIKSFFGMP